ncbi:MAG TPA: GTP cyclohydrolase II RibA [Thermoleophilaceae bacterium]
MRGVAQEVVRVPLPTPAGEFDLRAFACSRDSIYLVLVRGDLGDGRGVLTRLHSECLTGDALGSLRCDCGIQLRAALRAIASEGRGVLIYATGHEGRGIGLINKLRAYVAEDDGLDTLEANRHLGLPTDAREYDDAAACLGALGVRTIRLLTNNPHKATSLRRAGVQIDDVVALATSPHARNLHYLRSKELRRGHVRPTGDRLENEVPKALDVSGLLGSVASRDSRPYVVLKYAQTLDGRIATRTGDSKWISGEPERRASHALRAACDAVLVGIGTVVADDPQLTVRLVPGASPLRVVLDSTLRIPATAQILSDAAPTLVITSALSRTEHRDALRERGIGIQVVHAEPPWGVDLGAALSLLHGAGFRSLLVEGGAAVITSFLRTRLADRVVVGIAPTIVGTGKEAVGDLSIARVSDGLRLAGRSVHLLGDDVVMAGDVI